MTTITKAIILTCLLPAIADDNTRLLFDLTWTQPDDWQTAEGLTAHAHESHLILRNTAGTNWAAVDHRLQNTDGLTLTLSATPSNNASFTIQVEWFARGGKFITASDLIKIDKPVDHNDIPIPPEPSGKARAFRLKLWFSGADASADIAELRITAPLHWRTKNVRAVHTWQPDTPTEPVDKIQTRAEPQSLLLTLSPDVKYAGIAFADRADFPDNAVVMLDLQRLRRGSASLQLLCFDSQGKYLTGVDVLKGIDRTGAFEVPLRGYPSATRRISFKLWLGGQQTIVRLGAIHLATRTTP